MIYLRARALTVWVPLVPFAFNLQEPLPTYPEEIIPKTKESIQEESSDKDSLKLPDIPGLEIKSKPADVGGSRGRESSKSPGESEDPFDALVRRFDALKRK
jgi:hypothetical protein